MLMGFCRLDTLRLAEIYIIKTANIKNEMKTKYEIRKITWRFEVVQIEASKESWFWNGKLPI